MQRETFALRLYGLLVSKLVALGSGYVGALNTPVDCV
jgi:hypothetical protein